ncbi:hypothetical protein ACJJTC_013517 [Scirpophaga incertulas]
MNPTCLMVVVTTIAAKPGRAIIKSGVPQGPYLHPIDLKNFSIKQNVRNVVLLQHKTYVLKVIEETVHGLEDYGLCNLKVPDSSQDINVELFDTHTSGNVTYKNGFVISSQHIDVVDSTLQQVWRWNSTLETAIVSLRGRIRMHDVALGYDVEAVLNGDKRIYTSKIIYRMAHFDIDISTFMNTNDTTITVTGVLTSSGAKITFLPVDEYTPILTFLHKSDKAEEAVQLWSDTLEPIVVDVVVWRWNSTLETAIVSLRGRIRMHDVALGYDVEAVLNGDKRIYTSKIIYRMAHFDIDLEILDPVAAEPLDPEQLEILNPLEPELLDPIELEILDQVESEMLDLVEPDILEPLDPKPLDTVKPEILNPVEPEILDHVEPEPLEPDILDHLDLVDPKTLNPTEPKTPNPIEPEIQNSVAYTDGFLHSIGKITVTKISGEMIMPKEGGAVARFTASVELAPATVGYDVTAYFTEKGTLRFTGTYRHPHIKFSFNLRKSMNIGNMTVTGLLDSVGAGSGLRMIYMPENSYSEVLSRLVSCKLVQE